jgi:hypothetical protein
MNSRKMLIAVLVGIVGFTSLMAEESEEKSTPSSKQQGKRYRKGRKKMSAEQQKRKIMHYLNANYPTEVKAIRKLMKSDPEAATIKMKALAEKGQAKMKVETQEFVKLIKQYRETQDEAVLDKIKAKIFANYDKRIGYAEKAVTRFGKDLDRAENRLTELKNNREKNVDKIIDRIKSTRKRQNKAKAKDASLKF